MSIHINRFIDKIKMAESKRMKAVSLSIQEAKDLHGDITKLLLVLQELQSNKSDDNTIQKIEVSGGDFK